MISRVQRVRARSGANEDIESLEVKLDDEEMKGTSAYLSGFIATNGSYEVITTSNDSKLRMSRSFGDFTFKLNEDLPSTEQAVIALPEVMIHERDDKDHFLVLGCDGVWDVMSSLNVCDYLYQQLYDGKPLTISMKMHAYFPSSYVSIAQSSSLDNSTTAAANACDSLLEEVIRKGSQDNLTVVLVTFPAAANALASAKKLSSYQTEQDLDAIDLVVADDASPAITPILQASSSEQEDESAMSKESPSATSEESYARQLDFPPLDDAAGEI
jgi:hypothetical protein